MLLKILLFISLTFVALSFNHFLISVDFDAYAQQDNSTMPTAHGNLVHVPEDLIWNNMNKDEINLSTETNDPISGNGSLRADIIAANNTRESEGSWSIITTTPMPVNGGADYNYTMTISAKDVNQLHSKVYYLDNNKHEIESKFVFGGQDGTFQDNFSEVLKSPNKAKYHELQIWVRPNSGTNSSFLLDQLNLGQNYTYLFDGNLTLADQVIEPIIINNDSSLKVERIFSGLKFPTSMTFLGEGDNFTSIWYTEYCNIFNIWNFWRIRINNRSI